MNILAELSGMEPHKISFRVGLAMKNVHTFFDYVFRSRTMDKEVAKKLSGWEHEFDGEIYGGYPPSLKFVKTEPEKLEEFVKCLFGDSVSLDEEEKLSKDVRDLLAASIFRYYSEICTFISNEPNGENFLFIVDFKFINFVYSNLLNKIRFENFFLYFIFLNY